MARSAMTHDWRADCDRVCLAAGTPKNHQAHNRPGVVTDFRVWSVGDFRLRSLPGPPCAVNSEIRSTVNTTATHAIFPVRD